MLAAVIAWMIVQLIPLPSFIWHGFPGRDTVIAIDALLGQADIWRPISLTPSQTLNSLLGMSVPFAALLIAGQTDVDDQPKLLFAIVGIAVASTALAMLQIVAGPDSGLYFYRIANTDSMVGFFANRNHHAIFLASAILVVAMLLRDEIMRRGRRALVCGWLAIAALLFTVMTALIGSRAGFMAGAAAFGVAYVIVIAAWRGRPSASTRGGVKLPPVLSRDNILLYSPPLLLAALLVVALSVSDRTTGLSRFVNLDMVADARVTAWPTVKAMAGTYWTVGSGFGSFADAFQIYEPDAMLQPAYFNRAHNDWIEAVITGGLPFVMIIIASVLWVARTVRRTGMRNAIRGYRGDKRLPVVAVLILLAGASLFDYPLRQPSIQVFVVFLIVFLCCPRPANAEAD